MASLDDVKKLAALARIRLDDTEINDLSKDFDSILSYIGTIEKLNVSAEPDLLPMMRNVLREDTEPYEAGTFTEKLTGQFPARQGDSLKVKKIITHD